MTKIEKLNTALGIAGIIIGIFSVYYTQRSIKSNEEIAVKSGAFDKPRPSFGFGNYNITPLDIDTINVIYGANCTEKSVNFSFLPLNIVNTGAKNAEDVKLVISYPRISGLALTDSNLGRINETITNARRTFDTTRSTIEVFYQIQTINPSLELSIDEPFILRKTELNNVIDVPTKNGVIQYQYSLTYSNIISLGLLSRDFPAIGKKLAVSCIQESNLDSIVCMHMKSCKKEDKVRSTFIVIPRKNEILKNDSVTLNTYEVGNETIYYLEHKNDSDGDNIIVGIYGGDTRLTKLMVFNKDFSYKETLPISN